MASSVRPNGEAITSSSTSQTAMQRPIVMSVKTGGLLRSIPIAVRSRRGTPPMPSAPLNALLRKPQAYSISAVARVTMMKNAPAVRTANRPTTKAVSPPATMAAGKARFGLPPPSTVMPANT